MINEVDSGNGGGRAFDWEQARQRLEAAQLSLRAETDELQPEELQRIWEERAQRFAKAPSDEDQGEHSQLVIVRLGNEYYGLEANYVFRIRPTSQITMVPRVPAWIVGVANERGRILSVFDLHRFLGLGQSDDQESRLASASLVIIETPEMELAMVADEVLNVVAVPVSDIQEAQDTVRGIPQAYISGVVNRDLAMANNGLGKDIVLIVLSLRALLADERLRVHEEIV